MSEVDPGAPNDADELVRVLADHPAENGAPVAGLPEHLRDTDLLTVAEADGLVEFCHRNHCYVNPAAPELRIERGWSRLRWIPGGRVPMDQFLAQDRDERIPLHVRLTNLGRVRAARQRVANPNVTGASAHAGQRLDDLARARVLSEAQVREAAARVRDVPTLLVWAHTVSLAGWRQPDGAAERLIPEGQAVWDWLTREIAGRLRVDRAAAEEIGLGAAGAAFEALRRLEQHDPGYLHSLVGQIRDRFPKAASFLPELATAAPTAEPAHERPPKSADGATDDYSTVLWRGQRFEFNKKQAAVVSLFFEQARRISGVDATLRESFIANRIGAEQDNFRLSHTFRLKGGKKYHPAWGTMIVPGEVRGSYKALIAKIPRRSPEDP